MISCRRYKRRGGAVQFNCCCDGAVQLYRCDGVLPRCLSSSPYEAPTYQTQILHNGKEQGASEDTSEDQQHGTLHPLARMRSL